MVEKTAGRDEHRLFDEKGRLNNIKIFQFWDKISLQYEEVKADFTPIPLLFALNLIFRWL